MTDLSSKLSPTSGSVGNPAVAARARSHGLRLVSLGAMAIAFLVAYIPTYIRLANGPWQTEQEGHGPLIMLASVWLAWQQREKLRNLVPRPAPVAGWIVLIASLLVMAVTRSQDILMIETATQIPVLLACLLLIGGWPLAKVFAFPLAFLIFSVPPPGWILDALTVPLKAWVSDVVTNLLYALGYPIAQNGVIIMIGSYELMVKDACSGMNSIFALSAIGIFYVYEFVHNNWIRKAILILSIIPITVMANLFRVLALVLGSYYLGVDRVEGLFHDVTGIALFVFALVLFFLLDTVLIGTGYLIRRAFPPSRGAPSAT
ncbi:exosortase B [Roseiarcus fermentans]|uniref:Exosortase B n=1 Tax=Roseiarcus fermentans TaxID=1473586 RepID=A0A366FR59_9HYPH|nr:exosortase [Roseiarcus fermentans]RBP17142.1 exosortase B [Roseiarcus fermentans]